MKQSVYRGDFKDAFRSMGRQDQFSYDGLDRLFSYFEQMEEDTGEEIELDVIAICCEWAEYDDFDSFKKDTGHDIGNIEELEQHTTVLYIDNVKNYRDINAYTGRILVQEF